MYDLKQYVANATRTESLIDEVVVDPEFLAGVLQIFIASGNMLDQVKKRVFYGKDYDEGKLTVEFVNIVESLEQIKPSLTGTQMENSTAINPRLFHSLIGIATEATELLEALTSSDKLDKVNVLEEFGDLNWYQAIGIDVVGGDFESVLKTNIEKLRARFPDKYTDEKAINRDLEKEREILEENPLTDED